MIKLIATDLDGTLLNNNKIVPSGFDSAVRKLYQHGIRFAIASGREYSSIIRNFPALEEILIVITDNGALNYDGGRLIGDNGLAPQEIRSVYQAMTAVPEVDIVISGEHFGFYRPDPHEELLDELSRLACSRQAVNELFHASTDPLADASTAKIGKLAFYHKDHAWEVSRKTLEPFMDQFQIFPSEPSWVNLMKKGVDKGLGLRQLQQYLHCTPDECMAFGDYLNDCCMFREVKHSFAMANAHPDLKAIAVKIAPANEEEGVMRVLFDTFDFL